MMREDKQAGTSVSTLRFNTSKETLTHIFNTRG